MDNLVIVTDDGESREKIIHDLDTNFFVEAGAGSGKTTMLVNRMVALVEAGIPVEKICAITFTKAAAAEFYKRFQELLSERCIVKPVSKTNKEEWYPGKLNPPTEETAKNCAKALENIDLCFMNTIDSFCQMVLAEHPTDAQIPSDSAILEEDEMKELYKQEYIRIRKGECGESLQKKSDLFKRFFIDDVGTFVYGVNFVMGRRNISFQYDPVQNDMLDVDRYFADEKNKLIDTLTYLKNHPNYFQKYNNREKTEVFQGLDNYIRILRKPWSSNIRQVVLALSKLSCGMSFWADVLSDSRINKADFENIEYNPGEISNSYSFKPQVYNTLSNLLYSITMELMNGCVKKLEASLKAAGKLSFFDYLYFLRNLLDDDAKIKDEEKRGKLTRHIYERHSYFFIDEFQDTNPMQAEIFFHLTAKEPKEKWSECIPQPGSLFIVGDPKQSIYKFRSADVASYIGVKKLFQGKVGSILQLTKNFRSREVLTNYFNFAFNQTLPEDTDNQCKYKDITIVPNKTIEIEQTNGITPTLFEGIYTYNAYTGPALSGYVNMLDFNQVVKIIQTLVGNPYYVIMDKKDKKPRPITYKDFMLISYSKNNLKDFLAAFAENDIPFRSEGKVLFENCQGLRACCKILGCIAKPANSIALITALKSDVFGFTDNEIYQFTDQYCKDMDFSLNKEYTVLETDSIGMKINEAVKALEKLEKKSKVVPPSSVYNMILEEFKIFNKVSVEYLEVVYYTLELIRAGQKSGKIISLMDCVEFVEYLLSGASNQERCLSLKKDEDSVHLANLHKVKGLEAPIVILTYWYPQPPHATFHVDYSQEVPKGYLISCEESTGAAPKVYFKTSKFSQESIKDVDNENAEIERLVYVAATRPRNALIICKSHSGRVNQIKSRWRDRLFAYQTYYDATQGPSLCDYDVDFFTHVKPNPTIYKREDQPTSAIALYNKAEEDWVFHSRRIEEKSFTVLHPSGIPADSEFDENSSEGAYVDIADVDKGFLTQPDFADETDNKATREVQSERLLTERESRYVHSNSTVLGTSVHKLLEEIVSAKGSISEEDIIERIIKNYASGESEGYQNVLKKALYAVYKCVNNGGVKQPDTKVQDILAEVKAAKEVYCEVPFCYKKEKEVWNGIIDLIYKKDGCWFIVDYKTNAKDEHLNEKYEGQLNAYKEAVRIMMGVEADAYLYHFNI